MEYLPAFKFLMDAVAMPFLFVLAVYFLPLILKVTFLFFTALPFLSTTFTENLIFLAFFAAIFFAVNVGLKVSLF